MSQLRPTFLKIQLDHIAKNFLFFNSTAHAKKFICPMVKANAYGHGDVPVAHYLKKLGSTTFGVGLVEEGLRLRESGLQNENILVFGFYGLAAIREMLRANLIPVVSDWDQLNCLIQELKSHNRDAAYPIHLKFNTGMNRLGFTNTDIDKLGSYLEENPQMKVIGCGTHLMTSEDLGSSDGASYRQLQKFSNWLPRLGLGSCALHAYNTSGAIYAQKNSPATQSFPYGLRIGLGIYGYSTLSLDQSPKLYPSMSFLSKIVSVQNVKKNEVVSYGGTWRAQENSRVAIVPAGYADGIPTQLSNKGYVKIGDHTAPIIGRVCMDYTLVDITHLKSDIHSDVEFFGEHLSAHVLAEKSGTIVYDILTRVSERVPRVYFEGEVELEQ